MLKSSIADTKAVYGSFYCIDIQREDEVRQHECRVYVSSVFSNKTESASLGRGTHTAPPPWQQHAHSHSDRVKSHSRSSIDISHRGFIDETSLLCLVAYSQWTEDVFDGLFRFYSKTSVSAIFFLYETPYSI